MHDSTFKQSPAPPVPQRRDGVVIFGLVDLLIFSSVWVAGVAAVLASAASFGLGHSPSAAVVLLASAGTFVIYNVDRLRDLERDRTTSPLRSAFVERHEKALQVAVGLALLVSIFAASTLSPAAWLLCGGGLAIGLMHRRLKHLARLKPAYVTCVWLGVVVGLPAATQGASAGRLAGVLAVIGCAIFANLLASNLAPGQESRGIARALATAAAGVAIALLGPVELRALAAIPLGQAVALACYRANERYALVTVDGGLLVGGLVALMIQIA